MKCDCGGNVANPLHAAHVSGGKHQEWLTASKMDRLDVSIDGGELEGVVLGGGSTTASVVVSSEQEATPALHPDLQSALAQMDNDRLDPGYRHIAVAKMVRAHFGAHFRPNAENPETVRDFLGKHSIPVEPPARLTLTAMQALEARQRARQAEAEAKEAELAAV